jgi:hypothetical protein
MARVGSDRTNASCTITVHAIFPECSLNTEVYSWDMTFGHMGKMYSASTMVRSSSAFCIWDGGTWVSASSQPKGSLKVP